MLPDEVEAEIGPHFRPSSADANIPRANNTNIRSEAHTHTIQGMPAHGHPKANNLRLQVNFAPVFPWHISIETLTESIPSSWGFLRRYSCKVQQLVIVTVVFPLMKRVQQCLQRGCLAGTCPIIKSNNAEFQIIVVTSALHPKGRIQAKETSRGKRQGYILAEHNTMLWYNAVICVTGHTVMLRTNGTSYLWSRWKQSQDTTQAAHNNCAPLDSPDVLCELYQDKENSAIRHTPLPVRPVFKCARRRP